jgi:glucoamylase
MNPTETSAAFGAPGIEPRWTSSAKEGLGTAYHTSCRVWFTLSHGIVNEIYYPCVDEPNTRDFQFLITDGETFCHEEKRDLQHRIEYPERDCVFYQLTNSDPKGRYRLIKHILADPHRSVVLMHTQLEVLDESLRGKLRLYALWAPHIARQGAGNSGWCSEIGGHNLLHAERKGVHLVMGCSEGFSRRSVGYVGASDGWQDLTTNFKIDWEFRAAVHGNIALTGEIVPQGGEPFTVAIAFGKSCQSTVAKLLQSLAEPFEVHREAYVRQWQRTVVKPKSDFSEHTSDGGHMYRLSRCILLAHEDKTFQGALVASMSIPWGETKGDTDLGGYHLVWTRDLAQSATALLASGQTGTPLRALIWLAAIQRTDGRFPQNSWINGNAYWCGVQLDEVAAPILLAWRLHNEGVALGRFDPCVMISRAAGYLIRQGPVTAQERWEENAGYSPSTLATVIANLVCAAEFAKQHGEASTADFFWCMRTGWSPTLRNGLSPRPVNWSKGSGAITFESTPQIPRRPIRTPTRTPRCSQSPMAAASSLPGTWSAAIFFTWCGWASVPRTIPSCGTPLRSWITCLNATCRKARAGAATITMAMDRRMTAALLMGPGSAARGRF